MNKLKRTNSNLASLLPIVSWFELEITLPQSTSYEGMTKEH
jgi:hypothetical protein